MKNIYYNICGVVILGINIITIAGEQNGCVIDKQSKALTALIQQYAQPLDEVNDPKFRDYFNRLIAVESTSERQNEIHIYLGTQPSNDFLLMPSKDIMQRYERKTFSKDIGFAWQGAFFKILTEVISNTDTYKILSVN